MATATPLLPRLGIRDNGGSHPQGHARSPVFEINKHKTQVTKIIIEAAGPVINEGKYTETEVKAGGNGTNYYKTSE